MRQVGYFQGYSQQFALLVTNTVRALSPFSRWSDLRFSCCLEASSQVIASEAVTQGNDKTGFVFLCHWIALGLFNGDFLSVELRMKYDKDDNE